jgi:hypothetical protein
MYLAKAMLSTEQQDWKTATQFFKKAIHLNRQYELPWDEAKTHYEWGMMYLVRGQAGDLENVRQKFESALEIFQRIGAKKDVGKVLTKKELLVT